MDAGSQVDIQQLDDNTFNANVVRGRVSIRVRRFDARRPVQRRRTRCGVRAAAARAAIGSTRSTARAASPSSPDRPSLQGAQGPTTVGAGNALQIVANGQDPNAPPQLVSVAPVPVPLDDWVVARENRFNDAQTQRYVSPNMTGYEDLGANGQWGTDPDVGPVWYPTTYVTADWAPYRYGRWAYVAPWGYTWVDDAPWGFAPFHYGRWLRIGNRWGWCPGAYVARPVYAPALVGFYGGAGFTASFSIGAGPAIGWYPLAPWERFTPYYAHNAAYVNEVNNIRIVNAPPRFAAREGWNREHGATIVPQSAFASQRSISRVAMAAPPNLVSRAAAFNPAELPRPAAVPGAVRRGPAPGVGIPRPEFRQPREFAERAPVGGPRGAEAGRPPTAVGGPAERRVDERATLPPTYRRLPETAPGGVPERGGQPNVGGPVERAENPRGPSAPNFSREGRPVEQRGFAPNEQRAVAPNEQRAVAPNEQRIAPNEQRGFTPNGQRAIAPGEPRGGPPVEQRAVPTPATEAPNPRSPNVERFNARQQSMQREQAEAVERARQAVPNVERNNERPVREFRAPPPPQPMQAPQAAPPPQVARPAPVERPHVEQRAAPVAPAAPQPAPPGPRAERGPPAGREVERER